MVQSPVPQWFTIDSLGSKEHSRKADMQCGTIVQDVVFYGLPDHPDFYSDLVQMASSASPAARSSQQHASVTVLFTKFDALQLSQIVGSDRASKMFRNSKSTFVIC